MTMEYLVVGAILGLSAGLAPGPLLALVISETLQHDVKAGVKIAFAPVITDIPIIVLTLFVLSTLADFYRILGVISLTGGAFVLSMGYAGLRTRGIDLGPRASAPRSLLKGVLTNAASPHPYLFWLSVGAPLMAQALASSLLSAALFIVCFYGSLVGAKILLAIAVGKAKFLIVGKPYIYVMRCLGLLLIALACILLRDGLVLLGVLSG